MTESKELSIITTELPVIAASFAACFDCMVIFTQTPLQYINCTKIQYSGMYFTDHSYQPQDKVLQGVDECHDGDGF
jgi:hypothetical protein